MRVCSMPGCQTSAGCKCHAWPWQYPQVPSYLSHSTGPAPGSIEERLARLERIVEHLCPDKSHDI
jgi:hypothetical protein